MTNARPIRDCDAPWRWIVVSPEGSVQPCCFASEPIGNLAERSLEEVWNGAKMVRLRRAIVAGYVDPVCRNACCHYVQRTEAAFGVDAYDYRCALDVEVPITDEGAIGHCVSGWAEAHDWGVWSDGREAVCRFDVQGDVGSRYRLAFLCRGAVHEQSQRRMVDVFVNDAHSARWVFNLGDPLVAWREIDLSVECIPGGRVNVRFVTDEPVSPKDWGIEYGRMIGLGLSRVKITACPEAGITRQQWKT